MKQPFAKGFFVGGAITNAMVVTKGRFPGGRWATTATPSRRCTIGDKKDGYPKPDGKYTFDKLSSVYITGNATRDDAPNHIRVREHVPREVAEAWAWMCPAGVYEIPEDAPSEGNVDVIVNYTNCVQCGAITAKGGRLTHARGRRRPAVPGDLSARAPANLPAARTVPGGAMRASRSSPAARRCLAASPRRRRAPPRRAAAAGQAARRADAAGEPPTRDRDVRRASMPAVRRHASACGCASTSSRASRRRPVRGASRRPKLGVLAEVRAGA